jgi:hypothetical protein
MTAVISAASVIVEFGTASLGNIWVWDETVLAFDHRCEPGGCHPLRNPCGRLGVVIMNKGVSRAAE